MTTSESQSSRLRLRIFAGPNGSGKSTVIESIRNTFVNDRKLDFGIYINADDINAALNDRSFSFLSYNLNPAKEKLIQFANTSGLLSDHPSDLPTLSSYFEVTSGKVIISEGCETDRLAQIIARFLREEFLSAKLRFSFETVFSHESNLDLMKRAVAVGYKVYFYFVSTESPEINKYRVALRVKQGGHGVPHDKIEKRYYRSLNLLKDAAEMAYQAFFFDNSLDNKPYKLVGHFKKVGDVKKWDIIEESEVSSWFKKYYQA